MFVSSNTWWDVPFWLIYVATGYYRKRRDDFGVLGKLMIVLSLFYFQMKFKIGIFLFTLLGTITYPLPRHIWSWFSFSLGGRVPWRVNPSSKMEVYFSCRRSFGSLSHWSSIQPMWIVGNPGQDIILCPVWYVFLVYPLPSNSDNQDLVHFFC